jgi:hypothetical protein
MGLGEAPRATLNMVAHMLEGPAVHVERRCIGRIRLIETSRDFSHCTTTAPPGTYYECNFDGCLYAFLLTNNPLGRVPRVDALNHLPR